MELFFVSRTALAGLPEPAKARVDVEHLRTVFDRAGVPDRMPFLIGDDGLPVAKVNSFFRDLPATRCRSPETWRAYALDIFRFLRYLDSVEQVDVFAATNEHVERYRWVRLNGSQPVRPSTWNREVASLQRFYGWAVRRGHAAEVPFRYGDAAGRHHSYAGGRRNLARARVADTAPVRFLTVEQYLFFRDVGLYGMSPEGRRDPSFSGEQAFRNKLFADLLVTTGLRLGEAAALTRIEIPASSKRAARLAIAGPTAKRSKPRDVLVPAAVADRLQFYLRGARAEIVERHRGRRLGDDEIAVTVDGARSPHKELPRRSVTGRRREALAHGRGWPGRCRPAGAVPRPGRKAASSRGLRASFRSRVGPLRRIRLGEPPERRARHAPHASSHLRRAHPVRAAYRAGPAGRDAGEPGAMALRHVAENPLRHLQKLLGHSHVSTTYIYLDCLDEANELVDAALERWDCDATWSELIGAAS